METIQEKYEKLSKDIHSKYAIYLSAHRKATKNKNNIALQKEVEIKKQAWLEAITAKKNA